MTSKKRASLPSEPPSTTLTSARLPRLAEPQESASKSPATCARAMGYVIETAERDMRLL
ncbi:MAG: hypothetical protein WAM97_14435 [Acidimicrobiales bacterium]